MTAKLRPELAKLIERLSDEDQIAVALHLGKRIGGRVPAGPGTEAEVADRLRAFDRADEDAKQQLMKVRLSAPTYDRFQDWCSAQGISMAAAVRGLIGQLMKQLDAG